MTYKIAHALRNRCDAATLQSIFSLTQGIIAFTNYAPKKTSNYKIDGILTSRVKGYTQIIK